MDGEVLRFPGVPPMFSFHDPDGNTLYVVEQA
jgi:lactoylglutathione lyase